MAKLYKKSRVPVVSSTTAITPYKSSYRKKKKKSKLYGGRYYINPMNRFKLPKYALAQSNPFHLDVVGVKIPDSATTPSVGFPDMNIYTAAGTSGSLTGFAFAPSLTYTVASTAGLGSWTWAAAFGGSSSSSAGPNILQNFSAIRPVAHGIRIVANQNIQTAAGFVHMCLFPNTVYNVTTWQLPTTIGQMQRLPGYRRLSVSSLTQRAAVYVNKYLDETSYRYTDPVDNQLPSGSAKGTFEFAYQWNTIVIALEGTTTGSILEIENLVHYEGIVQLGSTLAVPATPAEPSNPNVTAGVSRMVAKKDPLIVDEGTPMEDTITTKIDTQNFCDAECKGEILTDTLSGTLQGIEVGYQAGGVYGAAVAGTAAGLGGFAYGVGRQVRKRMRSSGYQYTGGRGYDYGRRSSTSPGVMLGNNNNQIV